MSERIKKVIGYCDIGVEVNKKTNKPYSRILCINGLVIHLSEYIEPNTIVVIGYDYDIISQRVIYKLDSKLVINADLNEYLTLLCDSIYGYYNVKNL